MVRAVPEALRVGTATDAAAKNAEVIMPHEVSLSTLKTT